MWMAFKPMAVKLKGEYLLTTRLLRRQDTQQFRSIAT